MNKIDPLENQYINRLQLFLYLVPVVGFFPALWTLYRREGNKEQLAVSRLAVTLAIAWLSAYTLLGTGSQVSEILTLRLLIINSLLTSGYFIVCLSLMVQLLQGKSVRLPGFSSFSERVVRRHLS